MASVIAPLLSQNRMPIIGDPNTPRQRASRSRSAASAARRAVMSRLTQTSADTPPSSPRKRRRVNLDPAAAASQALDLQLDRRRLAAEDVRRERSAGGAVGVGGQHLEPDADGVEAGVELDQGAAGGIEIEDGAVAARPARRRRGRRRRWTRRLASRSASCRLACASRSTCSSSSRTLAAAETASTRSVSRTSSRAGIACPAFARAIGHAPWAWVRHRGRTRQAYSMDPSHGLGKDTN